MVYKPESGGTKEVNYFKNFPGSTPEMMAASFKHTWSSLSIFSCFPPKQLN